MRSLFDATGGGSPAGRYENIDLENAKKLKETMVSCGKGVGRKTSESKWATELYRCRKKYPDFDEVFRWFCANYKTNSHLRASYQSAAKFYSSFQEIRFESKNARKRRFSIPENTNVPDDLIDDLYDQARERFPEYGATDDHLRYACWEFLELCSEADEWLVNYKKAIRQRVPVLAKEVIPRVIQIMENHYNDIFLDNLQDKLDWEQWNGRLANTANNISLKHPFRFRAKLLAKMKPTIEYQQHEASVRQLIGRLQTHLTEIGEERGEGN